MPATWHWTIMVLPPLAVVSAAETLSWLGGRSTPAAPCASWRCRPCGGREGGPDMGDPLPTETASLSCPAPVMVGGRRLL